ncbi:uncharacterized protein METZ01_LOCUS97219 [marine metagenome]|uniref:Uncharacterized protein n=1 Tax=marine metagenome TaxID=408172 RepID=A0A381VVT6_9ZZZZ
MSNPERPGGRRIGYVLAARAFRELPSSTGPKHTFQFLGKPDRVVSGMFVGWFLSHTGQE